MDGAAQLALFDEPAPAAPVWPRWRAFLIHHLYGYGPNGHPIYKGQPSRRQVQGHGGDGTYAGELRAARKARREQPQGAHIEMECLCWQKPDEGPCHHPKMRFTTEPK